MNEYIGISERKVHEVQKMMNRSGWTVSLVGFDPERGVYAFDYDGEPVTQICSEPRLMDATVARNKLVRLGFETTEVEHDEATGWFTFTYQAPAASI